MKMKELIELQKKRRKDRLEAKTYRRKQLEKPPDKLSSVLELSFRKNPDFLRKVCEARVFESWPRLVGDSASSISSPICVKSGTLIIYVSDPVWLQQLLFFKASLLKKIQHEFREAKIYDIFFTLRRVRKEPPAL